jgi:2-polyprenyl-3-methyl-5-hydroxy-6-metoxy-1,4-benzoquinol methylase
VPALTFPVAPHISQGVGTASALVRSKRVILERSLAIVGIDLREDYIRKAARVIKEVKLRNVVTLLCKSLYDPSLREMFGTGTTRFDVAHFSGSLTLMPNPAEAIQIAAAMLQPDGQIFVTQTFQTRYVPLMRYIKPALLRFTTIDFGQLTYEHELDAILEAAHVQVVERRPIEGSVNNGFQTAYLLVLKPILKKNV